MRVPGRGRGAAWKALIAAGRTVIKECKVMTIDEEALRREVASCFVPRAR
jgi:hypothetical protein